MLFTFVKVAAGLLAISGPSADPGLDAFGDPLPPGAVLRLGTTRLRHAELSSLAFTADHKVVSFGRDHVLRVWDPATGRQVGGRIFDRVEMRCGPAGFLSADAGRVAVPAADGVKVFDVRSGRELAVIPTGTATVFGAQFSPDGRLLAVSDSDGAVRVGDVEARTTRELTRFTNLGTFDLSFSRDGRRLAIGHPTDGAIVFDLTSGRELLRYVPPDHPTARTVTFDSTGDVVAVLRSFPTPALEFVCVSTGRPAAGWSCPRTPDANWARFTPDGSTVVLGGRDGLTWVDAKTGRVIRTAVGPAAAEPAWSADGRLLASGGQSAIRVWNAAGRSVAPAAVDDAPAADVHGLAVSADGRTIVTKGTDDGSIRAWGPDGTLKAVFRAELWGGGVLAVDPAGRHVYGVSAGHRAVARWDLPGGREGARYPVADPSATYVSIQQLRLSSDGRRLAVVAESCRPGDDRSALLVGDAVDGRRLDVRRLAGTPPKQPGAISPDLGWYFIDGRAVSLAGAGEYPVELPDGWTANYGVVSADGRLVAWAVCRTYREGCHTCATPMGIRVHETATGRRVLDLPRINEWKMVFTPDGRELVVADEHDLSRWDLATATAVVRRPLPRRLVSPLGVPFASSLALTPDGRRAVTGHIDTTALVWDLTPPARPAKTMTERELSAAWADLAGDDAAKAYAAIWALADARDDAVPFLRARVRPVAAPTEDAVRKLVGRLDAATFAAREVAEKELRQLGGPAAPALRGLLRRRLSAEQAERVERILAAATVLVLPPGEKLRQVRAVAALELAGTAAARELLAEVAGGAAEDRVTKEAAGAVRRLAREG